MLPGAFLRFIDFLLNGALTYYKNRIYSPERLHWVLATQPDADGYYRHIK